MLRLTLRSSKDGRFLARIVDRGGFPFVLDFGDRRIIEDASQRLLHGFTMWRHGRLITAPPGDPDLLHLLADFYAGEGLLVFLEEPNWTFREAPEPPETLGPMPLDPLTSLHDLPVEDERTELSDDQTEIARVDPTGLEHFYDREEPAGVEPTEEITKARPDLDEDADTEEARKP